MMSNHLFFRLLRLPYLRTRFWVCAAFTLSFLPIGDQILWRYIYGFINDLSPGT